MHKRVIYLLAPLLVTGCSFFAKDDCDGVPCEAPRLLDNEPSQTTWYCYGDNEENWDCSQQKDPGKIASISADRRPARAQGLPPSARQPSLSRPPAPPAAPRPEPASAPAIAATPEPAPATREPEPAPAPIVEPEPEPTPGAAPTLSVARATPPPTPAPAPEARPAPAPEPKPAPMPTDLLEAPAGHYTVQLIALRDRDAVMAYGHDNGLDDPLYAEISNEGTRWYVLLLGVYPNLASAEAAKNQWGRGKSLKVQPWIRRLGPLQDAIRLAKSET